MRRHLDVPCETVIAGETEIIPLLRDVDVLMSMALTAEMGRHAASLKLLQVPGAGLHRIDRAALPHDPGVLRLDGALRRGEWHSQWALGDPIPAVWPELAGKTLGIFGYGRIGREVARRARAFDMTVCAIRRHRSPPPENGPGLFGGPEMKDEVLRRADHLVIAMPATSETRRTIGSREFSLMKPAADLINVVRAEIVNEAPLYEALARRIIAGAALDVWYRYPGGRGPQPSFGRALPRIAQA
ncbi:MAG: hypothetical protein J2P48_19095 [Alphaproteobacteria bacterium]|nr:hypothetical protein [Alphaproteobacteria bacterium]